LRIDLLNFIVNGLSNTLRKAGRSKIGAECFVKQNSLRQARRSNIGEDFLYEYPVVAFCRLVQRGMLPREEAEAWLKKNGKSVTAKDKSPSKPRASAARKPAAKKSANTSKKVARKPAKKQAAKKGKKQNDVRHHMTFSPCKACLTHLQPSNQ
jgi:hypothetical protein